MIEGSGDKPRIGYIGLGLMGRPMVERLLAAGFPVVVWNRTAEKAKTLTDRGAVAADSPADLATKTDFIFLCITNADAVEAVLFGPDGLASACGARIVVDFSTIHPDAARSIAERLKAANGMAWIDAPVSGGVPGAAAGTLAIMAGGEEADVEAVRPVVMQLCQRFTRMGPIGAGQSTKLVNQIISGCTMALVAEAVAFAEKTGVDAGRLTEALAGGFADSKPFQIFAPRMVSDTFDPPLGATNTMIKDLDTVQAIASDTGARTPLVDMALVIMKSSRDKGDGEKDIAAIVREFR